MYTSLRLRSQQTVEDIILLLEEMAVLDSRTHRAIATPARHSYISTASSPSLRARDSYMPSMDASRPGTPDAGNIKVVVRVRKFLKRGWSRVHEREGRVQCPNSNCRARSQRAMYHRDEPRKPRDHSPSSSNQRSDGIQGQSQDLRTKELYVRQVLLVAR